MKKVTLFLFAASLLPCCVLAWNTPGEDFSGELKLEGAVTSTRNPWVWKVGQGNEGLDVTQSRGVRDGGEGILVALPAMTVLLGKTTLPHRQDVRDFLPGSVMERVLRDFRLNG